MISNKSKKAEELNTKMQQPPTALEDTIYRAEEDASCFKPPRVHKVFRSQAQELERRQENFIEQRAQLVSLLETEVQNGHLEVTKAVHKFARITLFTYEQSRAYLRALGDLQIWERAV